MCTAPVPRPFVPHRRSPNDCPWPRAAYFGAAYVKLL